ncbi:MAG: hypothetical protein CMG71_00470 [Candidatus Marinimicrobia bacterium]|nr:hypothetical protein [Candidatus Neomarinimicrobiota bacterium]|tara:strand:- start:3937 stop:6381 length:2445 start_codon:yes stop_codon:yes gene_type:complete
MSRKRAVTVSIVLVLILIVGLRLYLKSPVPPYEGEVELSELSQTVEVFFDDYAVPHVYARNENDLFFAAGYLMARERLFQMTVNAATTEGRLSELFGEDQLESDIFLRTWGIPRTGEKLVGHLQPKSREVLETFCRGVNAYIDELGGRLPVEFKLLRIKPIRWEPKHATGYARLMAYSLSQSWYPEMLLGQVTYMFGEQKALELWPVEPDERPTSLPEISADLTLAWEVLSSADKKVRNLLGTAGGHLGSNSWVISGSRTKSGKPLLANDPHLGYNQPAIWYEMHLVGGSYDVSGTSFPGVPFIVLGQNRNAAWGFTNLMTDDLDFYLETVDKENPNRYLHDNQWKEMEVREETIRIKGGETHSFTVRATHRGPVISDIHPLSKEMNNAISFRWAGHDMSNEVQAFLNLNRMKNWSDFSEAVSHYTVPGQNIVYADRAGNVGWRPAVRIPIRKGGNTLVPLPGETSEYDWQGFLKASDLPYLFNPDEGFIATANNQTIPNDFPHYVSSLWHDKSRHQRIVEMVGDRTDLTIENMAEIQNDVVSPFGREISKQFIQVLTNSPLKHENHRIALRHLSEWDGDFSSGSAGALIFSMVMSNLLEAVYSDEMGLLGEKFYAGWIGPVGASGNWGIPLRNLRDVLKNGGSSWVDDVRTPNRVESLDEIIKIVFDNSMVELEQLLGPSPSDWWWGRLHILTHNHSIGGTLPLVDRIFGFNVGPFETGGSSTTVNNGEYSLSAPFRQVVGASFRRIVDLADMNRTQFIIPTGQSGIPGSPHYSDQSEMYNSGRYRTTLMDESTIRNSGFRKLLLVPASGPDS